MATLQGQEIKDTYQALLKTDGNININGNLQVITDGQGNASALALSTEQLFVSGTISNSPSAESAGWYFNDGGTSGSQYFLYNSTNRSIYLNAYVGDYTYQITSSLVDKYPAGNPISFIHTELGLLTGSIESSYFYDGEGDPLTIIKLTTDPSNGVNDTYNGYNYPPAAYYDTTVYSVLFGVDNVASYWGHAEGIQTTAIGQYSHTKGYKTIASGSFSCAEGQQTTSIGQSSHAEGSGTKAVGLQSHAEGQYTKAIGDVSHAEGYETTAIGTATHTEGRFTTAKGDFSHAEGIFTIASGSYSHAEGNATQAAGDSSHAEGASTTSIGIQSHAEGLQTTSIGVYSHTEGYATTSIGLASHAEGISTISSGSFRFNYPFPPSGIPQHAEGRWNVSDTASLLIVGNGTADNARSNALSVTTFGTSNTTGSVVLQQVSQSCNFANDTAAAAGGVPLGGLYHSSGTIKIRLV